MSDRRSRPFSPIDGLILAASLALGVAGVLLADPDFLTKLVFVASPQGARPWMPAWAEALEFPSKRVQAGFSLFLAIASLGAALATFRRGSGLRGPGGFPTPGVAATGSAALVLLISLGFRLLEITNNADWARIPAAFWMIGAWQSWDTVPVTKATTVSGAILGTWAYLILARAWRARDDWRDRLGRWLGWCWLGHTASIALFIAIWG